MAKPNSVIQLSRFTSAESMLMSGRERGVELRRKLNLDVVDFHPEQCSVCVPEHIISLNSSFFQGLFGESVRRLGEAKFRAKYEFSATQPILDDVDRGIRDALNEANPLR